jgi:hypothetical protein
MEEGQNTDFKYNEIYLQGLDDWDEPFQGRDPRGCLVPFLLIVIMILLSIIYVVIQG